MAIAQRLTRYAAEFGYNPAALEPEQADALSEVYLAERDVPVVEADHIRELYEAHDMDAIPYNDDIAVLAIDPDVWDDYAVMSAGEASSKACAPSTTRGSSPNASRALNSPTSSPKRSPGKSPAKSPPTKRSAHPVWQPGHQ